MNVDGLDDNRNVENPSPRTINPASKICEEEKQQRDSSATEKTERRQNHMPLGAFVMRSASATNSFAVSKGHRCTRCGWKSINIDHNLFQSASIGDAMATRVEISSSGLDSSRPIVDNRIDQDDTEDISTLTMETDNKLSSICTYYSIKTLLFYDAGPHN